MKDNLKDVGIWGQRHYQYLKERKPSVIGVMRLNGSLNTYLPRVLSATASGKTNSNPMNMEKRLPPYETAPLVLSLKNQCEQFVLKIKYLQVQL
ncbi:MAG: hypothetical protein IJR90_06115 [Clostridia bacterium]|nr:hypothetical protein [Clostridia bacterium]